MSSVSDSDAELSGSTLDNHQLTGFVLHGLASGCTVLESITLGETLTPAFLG